jgi:Zn-dependent peptidase ImmA (M78 family)
MRRTYEQRVRRRPESVSKRRRGKTLALLNKARPRGREIAQLFREQRGLLQTRACDLDQILEDAEVDVAESRSPDPGYAAVLLRLQGGGAGIMLAAQQSQGRRRFSLAHELGHFWIPSHLKAGPALRCADADLRARSTDSKHLEWEANDFAAELLLPRNLFANDLRHRSVSFATVEKLAASDMYNVSMTAAAWRLVQVTREPCALIMSERGRISWVVRSDAFTYRIAERNQPLGTGTIAAAVTRGESAPNIPEQIPAYEWLETTTEATLNKDELFESVCAIPSREQVLSLLWISEESADD